MPKYLLVHRHDAAECGVAFAAWKGFDSPLRHRLVLSSCREGGHRLWWTLDAPDPDAALASLPTWVAARTEVTRVSDVPIP